MNAHRPLHNTPRNSSPLNMNCGEWPATRHRVIKRTIGLNHDFKWCVFTYRSNATQPDESAHESYAMARRHLLWLNRNFPLSPSR